VYVRIVDVGPGLCAIIRAPGDRFMVYDAGHWQGQHCIAAVRELVTTDTIDLLVISHSDADHLGDAARILEENTVRLTLLAGEPRDRCPGRT
jgi:beta-lactamase superfamily II metal-dependent hydrolase